MQKIDGDNIIYHDYVDISIAIPPHPVLVVPPIHNTVESLQFHEIEEKNKNLADKVRTGKLSLEEMKGGTFTITNGGVFAFRSAILSSMNPICYFGNAYHQRSTNCRDGQVVVRPMMYLSIVV